jgi:peptide-methionine (S)-S-oxide reductase
MTEIITLAGGCFWCTEAIFSQIRGVETVTPGYSGGEVKNPSYEEVCTGDTGHAESVQIIFNPKVLAPKDLLYIFFKLHDPTTLNRQDADTGTQYRSAIFYNSDSQKKEAEYSVTIAQKEYKDPIVTEITKYKNFYPADPSHKEYYFKHRLTPYCMFVIDPKIQKLKKEFGNMLKN